MAKRQQSDPRLEISYYQKNKSDKEWMQYWFYVRTSGVTSTGDDGRKTTRYPLASVMSEMKPSTRVAPSSEVSLPRAACDKAFAMAYHYSGGRDLVETPSELVATTRT